MAPLPLGEVLRLARAAGLREVRQSESSGAVAFVSDKYGTRFHVHYATGTVGTHLLHPRRQRWTYLFRRNVTPALLRLIFQKPRIHTGLGYYGCYDGSGDRRKRKRTRATGSGCIIDDHERRRREKRERETEEVERIRLEAAKRETREEKMRRDRGIWGWWCLNESYHFEKNFTEHTSCVALGSSGAHLCLYDGGDWAYSSGLPNGVHRLLHHMALSRMSPDYAAFGSMGRYYISFENGAEGVGPQSLYDLLRNTNRRVKTVAFGKDFEDYFVVFEGGCYQYAGCPSGLVELIDCRGQYDLEKVTLGPEGEWSLWAKNDQFWWGNLSDAMRQKVSSVQREGGVVTDLLYGSNGNFFIRHRQRKFLF